MMSTMPLKRPFSSSSISSDDENPAKRLKREKNRISAARSRAKKSQMFQHMQDEIQILTTKNGQLTRTLSLLTNQCQSAQVIQHENNALREKIHQLELQSARLIAENGALQIQAGVSTNAGLDQPTPQQHPWCCSSSSAAAAGSMFAPPIAGFPMPPSHHMSPCQHTAPQGYDPKGFGFGNECVQFDGMTDACGRTEPYLTTANFGAPPLPATGTETATPLPNAFESSPPQASFDGTI